MKLKMPELKISGRLSVGFGILVVVLIAAVGTTLFEVRVIKKVTDRIVDLRTPTSQASASMVQDIYASLASLRGWMLTGNPAFKAERHAIWEDIAEKRIDMDALAAQWTNPKNQAAWADMKAVLDEFSAAQDQVEAIANTPEAQPATLILARDAAPLASILVSEITKIITLERDLPATPERKALLGMMADTRGTTARGLASIRAFLLTNDPKFKKSFDVMWKKNGIRFGDLTTNKHLLTDAQMESFNKFDAARTKFLPLPAKMFTIRASNKSDMANYLLVTEAAPRAGKLLTALLGPKGEDGSRSGGMVDNQKRLLNVDAAENASQISLLLVLQWIILAVGVVVASAVGFLTARSIVRPINQMTGAMGHLAANDLATEVPALENKDELGEMARAVQVFKDNMIKGEEMAAAQKMEDEQKEVRRVRMEELVAAFEGDVGEALQVVGSTVEQMQSSASAMSSTADQTNERSASVAAAAEQAATNVQTVATAANELTSSIAEISRQMATSASRSQDAVGEAESASKQVQTLAEAAQSIGDVISLINDIASQTNLLALNATIEAARAGDAGKGFAVVASEVKNLATQTSKATEEIASQINGIQTATEQSVAAITSISTVIEEINGIATSVAGAVEEQGAATDEIARSVEQAAAGTQEVTKNITDVSSAAGETGAAAGQVAAASEQMKTQADRLRQQVETFLKDVQAA
ncbi:MAG: HAMP domain-containing protein [Alphaproteobacteria bacterium]|nr:HAMP domain-containing protein [Alphaproteobacteria bacterium]